SRGARNYIMTKAVMDLPYPSHVEEVRRAFGSKTGLEGLPVEVKERLGRRSLVIFIASPSERHYRAANELGASLAPDHLFAGRIAVAQRKKGRVSLKDPEGRLLQQTLAKQATSDRFSFR